MDTPKKPDASTPIVAHPFTEDELIEASRELAAKLKPLVKIVDTYTGIQHQNGEINVIQTYWGPAMHYAVATPRRKEQVGASHLVGEMMQTFALPRLWTVSIIVPPGALPEHFRQLDVVLTQTCWRIAGARVALTRSYKEWDPTKVGDVAAVVEAEFKRQLYTGRPTEVVSMVSYTWDTGSDGEDSSD